MIGSLETREPNDQNWQSGMDWLGILAELAAPSTWVQPQSMPRPVISD
jgi:hypothetical protein